MNALATAPKHDLGMHMNGRMVAPTMKAWGLTRSYGSGEMKVYALRNVSLELYPGQITLLMGPSGSGKSTLLAVLSGLLQPDSGEVLALGKNIWQMSEKEREDFRLQYCGFIFQGYNLFPALTARQQLEMILRWGKNTPAAQAREEAECMLAVLGLGPKHAGRRPGELSGGEKQRVAIGRALIKEPAFCFADEPTSALDWSHGEQVIELLRSAARERGTTVLVVAHDARIIQHVDRVFCLEDGCLVESEPA